MMACKKLFTLWLLNYFTSIYHLVLHQVMENNKVKMHFVVTHLEKS